MNNKTKQVIRGWLNLTEEEKEEFNNILNDYEGKTYTFEKKSFVEEIEKSVVGIVLGPTEGSCPCCGR